MSLDRPQSTAGAGADGRNAQPSPAQPLQRGLAGRGRTAVQITCPRSEWRPHAAMGHECSRRTAGPGRPFPGHQRHSPAARPAPLGLGLMEMKPVHATRLMASQSVRGNLASDPTRRTAAWRGVTSTGAGPGHNLLDPNDRPRPCVREWTGLMS